MKIIFLKDVPKVARKNDVKDMPDGYVRNFLLPKGVAIPATPEALQKLERAQNEIRVEREVQTNLFKKNIQAVSGVGVTISVMTNEKGHLFKAIHVKDIVEVLKKEHRISMAEEFVRLPEPIKQAGTFTVMIEALGMKEPITVNVVSSGK